MLSLCDTHPGKHQQGNWGDCGPGCPIATLVEGILHGLSSYIAGMLLYVLLDRNFIVFALQHAHMMTNNLPNLSPDPDCGEKVTCVARSGKWRGQKICVEEEFICDNTLQCMGGEDERIGEEEDCTMEYFKKKIFKPSELFVCTSTFKYLSEPYSDEEDTLKVTTDPPSCYPPFISAPTTTSSTTDYYYDYDEDIFGGKRRRKRDTLQMKKGNGKRKFFPYRAVECDGAKQCPHGEDEAACDIDSMAIIFLGILNFPGLVGST